MLVHNICKKHNINSEIEPNKFYLSKKKYFYCSECQKERRRKHYLNNREHVKNENGTDKAGPGLKSQKELFCTLNFAVWKKVYNMSL